MAAFMVGDIARPVSDHQRQDNEEHAAIGQFLKGVVLSRMMELEFGVIQDVARQIAKILGAQRQVSTQMSVDQAAGEPREKREYENPSEEEVHDRPVPRSW